MTDAPSPEREPPKHGIGLLAVLVLLVAFALPAFIAIKLAEFLL